MSHFTTYTVYNILPCKQQNSLSQALKTKHSDKNNSPSKPDRQAGKRFLPASSLTNLSLASSRSPVNNWIFSEIPGGHHHCSWSSKPYICNHKRGQCFGKMTITEIPIMSPPNNFLNFCLQVTPTRSRKTPLQQSIYRTKEDCIRTKIHIKKAKARKSWPAVDHKKLTVLLIVV